MRAELSLVPISRWTMRPVWALVASREEFGGDLPLLSMSAEYGVRARPEGEGRAASEDLSGYRVVREGDLVINRLSARDGAYGVSRQIGLISPAYWVFRAGPLVDPRWLDYVLRSHSYKAELARISKYMPPAQFDLPWDQFRRMFVPVPPLNEQRKIANYLDAVTARIDALVEKKQRMVESLSEQRMSVMCAGVSGLLTSEVTETSRLRWLDKHGAGWRVAKLSLVAKLGSGHTPSRSHPEWWQDCKIPWVTTGEVAEMRTDKFEYVTTTREKISELGLANSSATLHPAGTVVLCRTASAGYSAIMATEMATSQDFATWTCGPLLNPRFLLLCLRAMRADLLGRLAMGSTHQTIYMPDLEALRIPLPALSEQIAIVDEVWRRLAIINAVEERLASQVNLLLERRQALITAAITGELKIAGVGA